MEEIAVIEVKEEEPEIVSTASDLFAVRVWACKSVSTSDFVYLAMVLNLKTGKVHLRTLGQSQFGNLGQGPEAKNSPTFMPIDLDEEPRSPEDVVIGYDHTFMIGKNGKVYGWGSYGNEDKQIFKPSPVKFFNKFDVHKIASS